MTPYQGKEVWLILEGNLKGSMSLIEYTGYLNCISSSTIGFCQTKSPVTALACPRAVPCRLRRLRLQVKQNVKRKFGKGSIRRHCPPSLSSKNASRLIRALLLEQKQDPELLAEANEALAFARKHQVGERMWVYIVNRLSGFPLDLEGREKWNARNGYYF